MTADNSNPVNLGIEPDGVSPHLRESVLGRARITWPALTLDDNGFLTHFLCHWPPTATNACEVDKIHVADLYLAYGCSIGDDVALATFYSAYGAHLDRVLGPLCSLWEAAEDVKQTLLVKLFVSPSPGTPARIASYSGRGPLAAWLAIAAKRAALSVRRSQRLDRDDDLSGLLADGGEPGIEALKARCRGAFEEALKIALAGLPVRERVILRLHMLKGLSLQTIGTMYAVNQSTVSRWLEKARDALLQDLRRQLTTRLGVASAEVDSLVKMVQSQIDIGLSADMSSAAPAVRAAVPK